jgi:excisionase family DNA binding protein
MAVARNDELLTPAEVAALFRVDPKTVTRWANAGKLTPMRTLGGHRRYSTSEIRKLVDTSRQAETAGSLA